MRRKGTALVLALMVTVGVAGLAGCTSNRQTLCKNHPNNAHCQTQ